MSNKNRESGFSYIEVLISLVILMVGILAATAAMTANLMRSYHTEKQILAKQIALSTIESVFTARDIKSEGALDNWNAIANVNNTPLDDAPGGIFLNDWRPIREEIGVDGVAGTADDACDVGQSCATPGKPANSSPIIEGYERKIEITDVLDPTRPTPPFPVGVRRIDVKVRYFVNKISFEEEVSTLIINY